MSLDWVKVYSDLPDHPKIKKLEKIVGIRAFDFTVRTILWLSRFRGDGDTNGVEFEIEDAVRFDGVQGHLIRAMRDKGLIDHDGFWHDWDEIQTAHKERADASRRKREAREREKADRMVASDKKRAQRQIPLLAEHVTGTAFESHENVPHERRDIGLSQNVTVTSKVFSGEGVASTNGHKSTPSQNVTVTSPLLSSPLISSSASGGGLGEDEVIEAMAILEDNEMPPLPANIREVRGNIGGIVRAVTQQIRPRRADTIVGLVEREVRAESPSAYLAQMDSVAKRPRGEVLQGRFPAFDGVNGRLTLLEFLSEIWPRFVKKAEDDGNQAANRALLRWLSEDYESYERRYNKDRAYRPNEIKAAPPRPRPTKEQLHAECERLQQNARATVAGEARDAIELPPDLADSDAWKAWYAKHKMTVVQNAMARLMSGAA